MPMPLVSPVNGLYSPESGYWCWQGVQAHGPDECRGHMDPWDSVVGKRGTHNVAFELTKHVLNQY
jgi:hypothetical protein